MRGEDKLVKEITEFLEEREWYVERMHASAKQKGIPDLYILHKSAGTRWVEIKLPGQKLNTNQIIKFNKWTTYRGKIWVMRCTADYSSLFEPPNWKSFQT